ncbi:hypothetical protein WEI85_35140 [Actinomycetes bacterium KLBMP 9797]
MPQTVELIVPNNGEFNVRNAAVDLGPRGSQEYLAFGAYLADQAVFWSTADRVLVLPAGYDPLWFADVHDALGLAPPPVVAPRHRTGRLVNDLLHDPVALSALRANVADRPVRLLSWGATAELFLLAEAVRGWGVTVQLDGVAEENHWTSLYLDSKVSCLDLARDVPGLRVPRSITVTSRDELRGAIAAMAARHSRVIVKSPYGVAGQGSAVVDAGDDSMAAFWATMHDDPYFRAYPLIVQEFITHAAVAACPALDFQVGPDGVSDLVVSAVTTAEGHLFQSVNVGAGALPAAMVDRIVPVAHRIGAAAADLGFRGWLCLDMIAAVDGEIYLSEINARRSGAMHSIGLLRMWRADSALTLSSHDLTAVSGPAPVSYRERVRPVFQRAWSAGIRAYPTAIRGLAFPQPLMAVVAAGRTASEAEKIVADLTEEINASAGATLATVASHAS